MREFLNLALRAGQALTAPPAAPRLRPWRVIAGVAGLALCLLIAAVFLLVAIWLALLPLLGPIGTALVIAAVAVATAMVIALLLRPGRAARPDAEAGLTAAILLAEAERVFKANKATALVAAMLAGLVTGASDTHQS